MNGRGLRYRDDTGIEAMCLWCRDWWPLTAEFWQPKKSLSRCKACLGADKRAYQNRRYREDPAFNADKRAAARLTAWKDRINKPATVADRKRRYYQENRLRILEGQRRRYAEKRAA